MEISLDRKDFAGQIIGLGLLICTHVDRLVVLRHLGDILSGDLDAAGPALEASGAAVSASTYDVSRAPSARARIYPTRGRGASPPILLSPP